MAKINKVEWPKWPNYGEGERSAVERVIRSNQLFAASEVQKFEKKYSDFIKSQYALGLGNATQGLHLALASINVGAGDEVIVTPYSWISSASCILMQNAVPIFCDIEKDSLGIDPEKVEEKISKRTKAIIVVHMFGYPARITEILKVANKHDIHVIEDASHAHGAQVDGKMCGSFGKISVFSLHQRKALSVGDGGVVCTNDKKIYEKIYRLRSFGHNELSYNYRMTEFAAAIGLEGLKKIDNDNNIRQKNALMLKKLLSKSEKIKVRTVNKNEKGVYYSVLLELIAPIVDQDIKILKLNELGVPIRKTWTPLHLHPHFNQKKVPARGYPWLDSQYDGIMKNKKYSELNLPMVKHFCSGKILELEVYPPIGPLEIEFAAKAIQEILV